MEPRARRLDRALRRIDEANAEDPNVLVVEGVTWPKELIHGRMAQDWVERLEPGASDALRIAARAHHLRRWEVARRDWPEGRSGYLRWRKACQRHHAATASTLLERERWEVATILRVVHLVRKKDLGKDREAQCLEDALCLVFLETQLGDFAARHPAEKAMDVLRKTLKKMTPRGRRLALEEARLETPLRELVQTAAEPPRAGRIVAA